MPDAPDMKPRSRDVTDGMEKTAARGMLRAVGMGDEDFAKPQIGVASSWNEEPSGFVSPVTSAWALPRCTSVAVLVSAFATWNGSQVAVEPL